MKVSVDGTDFRMWEPSPFSPRWFSHKFNGPALRYEVGLNIRTGDIVWIHGPFPAGEWPDLRISRYGIVHHLLPGEMLLGDGGFADGYQFFVTPTGLNEAVDRMMALVRARHETVNRRFKTWGILYQVFRHDKNKHGLIFGAIAQLEQLQIENGRPLFQVLFDV